MAEPKTMQEAFDELGRAWKRFLETLAEETGAKRLMHWLERRLERRGEGDSHE